jgi:acyl-CoA oxidase
MAYDAAISEHVDPDILALFEAGVILDDSSWFSEVGGLTRERQRVLEDEAATRLLPRFETLLDATGVAPYVHAPIATKDGLSLFIDSLPFYDGDTTMNLIPRTPRNAHGTSNYRGLGSGGLQAQGKL